MQVFEACPNEGLTPSDIARHMQALGLFVPFTMDVHIRQLFELKRIERPERGVYFYRKEIQGEQSNLFNFDLP